MKLRVLILFMLFCNFITAQEKFRVRLKDTVFLASPGIKSSVIIGGQPVDLIIEELDTLFYSTPVYGFRHLKHYQVSKTEFTKGSYQLLFTTSSGSGFLIQEYNTLNPESMPEIMLKEVTKEKINYGYAMTKSSYQRTLKTGQKIDVLKAELKYKEEMTVYEFVALAGKDSGVLILTQLDFNEFNEEAKRIINLLWESLEFYIK